MEILFITSFILLFKYIFFNELFPKNFLYNSFIYSQTIFFLRKYWRKKPQKKSFSFSYWMEKYFSLISKIYLQIFLNFITKTVRSQFDLFEFLNDKKKFLLLHSQIKSFFREVKITGNNLHFVKNNQSNGEGWEKKSSRQA